MGYLHVGCVSLVGLVFLVGVVSKLRDLRGFAASVPGLVPGLPGRWTMPLAVLVVALEALAAGGSVSPATRPYALCLAGGLLAAFGAAIGRVVAGGGPRVSCRCFGTRSAPLGARHLVRNGVLLAACLLGLTASGPTPVAGAVVAAAAGALAAVLIVSLDDLAHLLTGGS
ncbi:MauE/DoxX family redox-associated membrane protein [Actinomadura syzygii]|uniref:Methylamine utilization protein MauE n=1 Tax=Actinomadura syzygii TaxID=1427538 RepID=A0A5D0UGR8_9ACTN|nr:MauE/DoxX family redox-associated membrane protein [Actinomadura syzygii]TYC16815.1 methylamine utilization protein MauE [Actinomadura syzygii]